MPFSHVATLFPFPIPFSATALHNGRHVIANPTEYTVLTLQKTLVAIRHVVIYGAESCVDEVWSMVPQVDVLREYNTVLDAVNDPAVGLWQRIKGGGVDEGPPVREAATALHRLLVSKETVRRERIRIGGDKAPEEGSRSDAAYMSDQARLQYVQKRMEMDLPGQARKSNLAKSDSAFGGGYSASAGKGGVVGAAHGIEEMIKAASREQRRFTDAPTERERVHVPKLDDFADMLPGREEEQAPDLLGVGDATDQANRLPYKERDLFDDVPADYLTGVGTPKGEGGGIDLLGLGNKEALSADIFGAGVSLEGGKDDSLTGGVGAFNDLLNMSAPVAVGGNATDPSAAEAVTALAGVSVSGSPASGISIIGHNKGPQEELSRKKVVMGGPSHSEDALSALDEVANLSLGPNRDGPPPLPSDMPPPVPLETSMRMPPAMPLNAPPLPSDPPLAPPLSAPPPLPPPELPPPDLPPPLSSEVDVQLTAEFGEVMGGVVPPPFAPPPPPSPPLEMHAAHAMNHLPLNGSARMISPLSVAPSPSGVPLGSGIGADMGGMGDMGAMMQAVQSGSLSQEDQAKMMQQMMMQNMQMMQMLQQQQQNNSGEGFP